MDVQKLFDDAVVFATKAHSGQYRKGTDIPYILHPLEAAGICSGITSDPEVLAAAVLHDVVEDTGTALEEIRGVFGERVAEIVAGESEDKRESLPATSTWKIRKQEGIDALVAAQNRNVKVVCLGDKLSNIRAIYRDLETVGDGLWSRFNQSDPKEHARYYRSLSKALLSDLGDTVAWEEFDRLVEDTFSRYD